MLALGHPLHPITIHAPLGLLLGSAAWDVLWVWQGPEPWALLGRWTLLLGLIFALPAAGTGVVDYLALPASRPIRRLAIVHLILALLAVAAYGTSLLFRWQEASLALCLVPAGLGLLLLMAAGWFGGELVYGHGVGQRPSDEGG